ncbi:DNA-binding domain-containing protein [Vibrio amylolyticus]|uniref:HvfC/BufC N-terminal domain-containing protein n=1 Tax=Vibrio amylolyticus TaxID=2847292 RepID=UPI00354D7C09
MNTSLAHVQQQFANALHYQASGEDCLITSDHFSADERMQIYRNNFIVSLSEVLEATYPMTLELVGEECFTQLARQHVLTQPLTHGDVTHYGEGFVESIEHFPAVIEAAPYLTEVARFEWFIDQSQQIFSNQNQSIDNLQPLASLSHIASEKHAHLRFHLQPSAIAFSSHHAIFSLQHAMLTEQFDGLELNNTEQGVIACQPNGEVWHSALNEEQHQLLVKLNEGAILSEIEEPLLAQLEAVISLNLVIGFTIDDPKEPDHE